MPSVSEILERTYTIDDTNEDMWEAIDLLRKDKDRAYAISQSQRMGQDMQRKMHANNPMQLKMLDQQIELQAQMQRRQTSLIDNKIQDLNRLLDAKKVRDQELLEKGLEDVQNDVSNLKVETASLAGQINLLKKEASERKKEIDDHINQVRAQAAKQEEWNEEIYSQVYSLQANSQLLMAEYDEKQKNLREKQYIEADPNTNAFYKKVFSKMNEVFIASKAIQSGMVSRTQYAAGDKAAGYITLIGSMIPLPAAATIAGYVSKGVQYLSDKREGDRINNISSNALGFSEMDEICDWISRGLVFAYEEQIRALTSDAASKFAECCVVYVLDFLARTEAQKTAATEAREAATAAADAAATASPSQTQAPPLPVRPLPRGSSTDTIGANNVPTSVTSSSASISSEQQPPQPPAEKITVSPRDALVSDLLLYMSNRTGVKNGKYGLQDVELATRIPGLTFTDRGIIKQCGLRTETGAFYHAPPPTTPKDPNNAVEQIEHGLQRGVIRGLKGEREGRTRTPTAGAATEALADATLGKAPPNMKRSTSVGARLFKWGQSHVTVKEVTSKFSGAKSEAGDVALDLSLKFKDVLGAVISGEEPCRPEVYGYRLGTQREAAELGLFQVPVRTVSRVLALTPDQVSRDPKAQSKFWTGK
ncbi:UNVERIFIED_CONTAM: hypothetical protein HDU68_005570 [Siphonaria sp. JEL0065]|nr:hypothetical protein HDU68_005570 [Siphonaria sp. JEL0065]